MKPNKARANILLRINNSIKKPVVQPFAIESNNFFQPLQQDLTIEFAENFNALSGRFAFCANATEIVEQLNILIQTRQWAKIYCCELPLRQYLFNAGYPHNFYESLADCDAAITTCEALVARTGSIMLSSALTHGRTASVYAPIHICIAESNQLVYDISDAFDIIKNKYKDIPSFITLASGPSRTADIEKTLVTGVHGPKEVFCMLSEDRIVK